MADIGLQRFDELRGFVLAAERRTDGRDMRIDVFRGEAFLELHDLDTGGFRLLKRGGRPGFRAREDEIGGEREKTFRRKLADIADIGKVCRDGGIEARGIHADESVARAERVDDLGGRPADADDAGFLCVSGQGECHCREQRACEELVSGVPKAHWFSLP